ncbi:hypothetical protein EV421DRAFT_1236567 [Armillaria borealis]|uniref:Uncharacterized protein n=1 Tax=Armillaria borealis TaxID=47425 RepID=A0AA39J6Y8_9AGAR|nr:hypothetical protein EV421DRAFT_1236567 [Armillaria borealis]
MTSMIRTVRRFFCHPCSTHISIAWKISHLPLPRMHICEFSHYSDAQTTLLICFPWSLHSEISDSQPPISEVYPWHLTKNGNPSPAGIFTYHYWRWSLFPRFSNTAANSENILHEKIMASLNEVEAISEQKRLKGLFGLLTQAVITLRRCEVALYTLDEEWMVIVGSSNLIDASRRAAQVFVRSAVYQTCAHLPETTRHELAAIFEKDDFMNSVVLQPLRRSSMDQRKECTTSASCEALPSASVCFPRSLRFVPCSRGEELVLYVDSRFWPHSHAQEVICANVDIPTLLRFMKLCMF